ncbi:uncharacterized protein VICG_01754 [Vittaforma corneae ATCC 50505]|uniref:Uncharacterized protein n=1 Tax=Vittaforma corneae (strain ATCC 50505) TaxID=993615 RepID=L2GKZ7_VITCO|nr:uncharacterized protein VICG_01754 [Vittaforma corneae ATCC 50505]ELA41155.1 hypothetical protein VICG_01754 [Vittaforma corneae ATCC 50505]
MNAHSGMMQSRRRLHAAVGILVLLGALSILFYIVNSSSRTSDSGSYGNRIRLGASYQPNELDTWYGSHNIVDPYTTRTANPYIRSSQSDIYSTTPSFKPSHQREGSTFSVAGSPKLEPSKVTIPTYSSEHQYHSPLLHPRSTHQPSASSTRHPSSESFTQPLYPSLIHQPSSAQKSTATSQHYGSEYSSLSINPSSVVIPGSSSFSADPSSISVPQSS